MLKSKWNSHIRNKNFKNKIQILIFIKNWKLAYFIALFIRII